MKSRFIHQADDATLVRQVREHEDREYAELRDAVQAGSAEDRRPLAVRSHARDGCVRWQPVRARRA